MKAIIYFFCAMFVVGCSQGAIDNNYDRYMNVFGLHYADPPANTGGILGRVLQSDQRASAFSQVHARPLTAEGSSPAVTTTNAKGGFYLGGLAPGAYRVFIMAPTGEGLVQEIEVSADQVVENENIMLKPLARVAGQAVLADEPVHTGIVIYALGTPFSAFTDHEGMFFLDLPAGQYEFRAEKDGYMTYQSPEPETVEGEVTLDITLETNPWPAGRVTVDSEDGFIVRGRNIRLQIEPVPGVRYMKVVSGRSVGLTAEWTKVKSTLEFEHDSDGYNQVQVQFMDAYGKRSEPVGVKYYNTSLDASWRILHGYIEKPVRIRRGSKVYFLAFENYVNSSMGDDAEMPMPISGDSAADEDEPIIVDPGDGSGGVDPADPNDGDDADNADDGGSGDAEGMVYGGLQLVQEDDAGLTDVSDADSDSASNSSGGVETSEEVADSYFVSEVVTFLHDVVIEPGVELAGAAHFAADVEIHGTAAAPVVWRGPTHQYLVSRFSGASSSMQWVNLSDVRLRISTSTESRFTGDRLIMKDSDISVRGYNSYAGGPSVAKFSHSEFVGSRLGFYCSVMLDGTGSLVDDGASEVPSGFAQLTVEHSVLASTPVDMSCYTEQSYLARYRLHYNNFLEPEGYYLNSSYAYSTGTGGLPADEVWDAVLTDNHFRHPGKQYESVADFGWRFGENIEDPWPGAGRETE